MLERTESERDEVEFAGQGGGLVGGIVLGFALFNVVQAIAAFLVAPLVMVFAGGGILESQSFSINGSEFRYGAVIESAIGLALAVGVVYLAAPWLRARVERSSRHEGG